MAVVVSSTGGEIFHEECTHPSAGCGAAWGVTHVLIETREPAEGLRARASNVSGDVSERNVLCGIGDISSHGRQPLKSAPARDRGPGEDMIQHYILQARQMQALSFIVHIPLVCFGIAFPAMILFVEWRYLRTGDEVFRTLARRWTKVLVALFAAGVVTGTILSFEMGLLWPNFTSTFGSVFGLGFAIEGFSFFLEAIFIGVYVYGWDRMSPRAHFLSGLPIAAAGVIGSFMVISVNGWMNHPEGFRLSNGRAVDVHPFKALFGNSYFWHEFVHMYLAGFIVTGFLVAGAYAFGRLRGRWGRYERTALTVPLTAAVVAAPLQVLVGDWAARDVATNQPVKLAAIEGLGRPPEERPNTCSAGTPTGTSTSASRSRGCCRCWRSTTRTRPCRASTRSRSPTSRR